MCAAFAPIISDEEGARECITGQARQPTTRQGGGARTRASTAAVTSCASAVSAMSGERARGLMPPRGVPPAAPLAELCVRANCELAALCCGCEPQRAAGDWARAGAVSVRPIW